MAMARVSGSAVPALLVALLICAAGRVAVVGGAACDGVSCGMGTCKEVKALIPHECECDPGWAKPLLIDFCIVPTCPDHSCLPLFNLYDPIDPCGVMNCGLKGTCIKQNGIFNFTCQCQPGAANALNRPFLPCIENCVIGEDSCTVLPPPQRPDPTSPAPPGNHDSSGPTSPSSTKGNATSLGPVSLQNLLQLLLLASLAAVQIV